MKLKAYVWASILVVSAIPASALSFQASPKTVEEADRQTFNSWDNNHDGSLNQTEYTNYAMFDVGMNQAQAEGMFSSLDGDSSGGLSFGEFTGGSCCT